jgi:hypothetical protein
MSTWKCPKINCRGENSNKSRKCWKCGETKREKPKIKRK